MAKPYDHILAFWFEENGPAQWFVKNPDFDQVIRERFMNDYEAAKNGEYGEWMADPQGSLALCVLLDQFPRNMFRDTPQAFATDDIAKSIAACAIENGQDLELPVIQRRFLYLPYEHSEAPEDQIRSIELFSEMKDDDEEGYLYAVKHKEVIDRFGRFPHRNTILGRENTAEEQEYLAQPGAGF